MLLLASADRVFGVPRLGSDWSIQIKEQDVAKSLGSLIQGLCKAYRDGREERMLIARAIGEVLSGSCICLSLCNFWASLVAQLIKTLPSVQKTPV